MKRKRRAERDRERKTTATSEDWVLGRRPAPFIIEKPAPYRPELRLLLDAGAGVVVAVEAVPPGESASAFAEWAAPKLPRGVRLRVDEAAVAEALQRRMGEGTLVLDAPTPEADEAVESLEAFSDSHGGGKHQPEWRDSADANAKAGFYAAAEHFEQARPWELASDGQVLAIDVPALGWKGACASILGMAEESFGLLLLRSIEDYVRFTRLADAGHDQRRPPLLGVPLFSVNFDRPRDLPGGKKQAAEARAHGFVPGPLGRVPYILNLSPDAVPIPPTTDDYRLAAVCLEAVSRFVEGHGEMFTDEPEEQVIVSTTLTIPGDTLDVVVTCPPADLPWRWGEEEPIEGLHAGDSVELCASFHAARVAGGESAEEADTYGWAAREMLAWKAQADGALTDWTPADVAAYLLEYYPSHGTETGPELEAIPSRVDAFLAWLAASGSGHAQRLEAARRQVARCREAFLQEASDPRRFGAAKAIVQAMQAANVDTTDRAAVDAFMGDFNRRLADDPSLLSSLPRHRKAWVWNGEGPPPDPQGPCPCGSGRRYRKCCMPR